MIRSISACGGTSTPSSPAGGPAATPAVPGSTATSTPAIAGTAGIILLNCTSGKDRLEVRDPRDGRVLAAAATGATNGCAAPNSYVSRHRFNDDYTLTAVGFGKQQDGSSHIGFRPLEGSAVDVTAQQPKRDFAIPTYHSSAIFRPGSTELWFVAGTERNEQEGVAYVDINDRSLRLSKAPGFAKSPLRTYMCSFEQDPFIVTRDAWLIPGQAVPNPKGNVAYGHTCLLRQGRDSYLLSSEEPTIGAPSSDLCYINSWVDDTRMLCANRYGLIYLGTFADDYKALNFKALIPESTRSNTRPIPSASRDEFAFISCDPDRTDITNAFCGLYRQAIAPGGQPTKLVDLPDVRDERNVMLLEWR